MIVTRAHGHARAPIIMCRSSVHHARAPIIMRACRSSCACADHHSCAPSCARTDHHAPIITRARPSCVRRATITIRARRLAHIFRRAFMGARGVCGRGVIDDVVGEPASIPEPLGGSGVCRGSSGVCALAGRRPRRRCARAAGRFRASGRRMACWSPAAPRLAGAGARRRAGYPTARKVAAGLSATSGKG